MSKLVFISVIFYLNLLFVFAEKIGNNLVDTDSFQTDIIPRIEIIRSDFNEGDTIIVLNKTDGKVDKLLWTYNDKIISKNNDSLIGLISNTGYKRISLTIWFGSKSAMTDTLILGLSQNDSLNNFAFESILYSAKASSAKILYSDKQRFYISHHDTDRTKLIIYDKIMMKLTDTGFELSGNPGKLIFNDKDFYYINNIYDEKAKTNRHRLIKFNKDLKQSQIFDIISKDTNRNLALYRLTDLEFIDNNSIRLIFDKDYNEIISYDFEPESAKLSNLMIIRAVNPKKLKYETGLFIKTESLFRYDYFDKDSLTTLNYKSYYFNRQESDARIEYFVGGKSIAKSDRIVNKSQNEDNILISFFYKSNNPSLTSSWNTVYANTFIYFKGQVKRAFLSNFNPWRTCFAYGDKDNFYGVKVIKGKTILFKTDNNFEFPNDIAVFNRDIEIINVESEGNNIYIAGSIKIEGKPHFWFGVFDLQQYNQIISHNKTVEQEQISSNDFINNHGLKIYPNPSTDIIEIIIEKQNLIENTSLNIEVFDMFGKKVLEEKRENNKELFLNIQTLQTGMYMIKIGDKISRFVKI